MPRVIPQGTKPGTRAELRRRREVRRGRLYGLTAEARGLLREPLIVDDHSARCTCLACVAERIGFRRRA